MITRILRLFSITLLFATVFSGCGGGGGGGNSIAPPPPPPPPPPPTGGIVRTGITSGVVSGFGSVFVNGVEYETNNATITVDDQPGTESDLKVGHVIQLTGTVTEDEATGIIETGEAETIVFDDNVKGPIDSRDLANNTMVVMGQTVSVDADTSFDDDIDPPALEGLMDGEVVEVSGFTDANGNVVATRVERSAAVEFEVRGIVSSLNAGNMTFNINALVVDFSAATLDNFPSGMPSDGDFVEAKGMTFGAGGELQATRVELEDQVLTGNDGDNAEIEGLITRFVDETDFDVAGFPVTTNAQTVFEGGTAQDLGLNVKVEAEGDLDANGTLVADKVDIRRGNVIRLESTIEDVNAAAGTVTILGITVTADALTRFEDKSAASVEPFGLANLSAGDFVEIRGAEDPPDSGMVIASRLDRDDLDPDTIVQGFVQSVADPNLDILGVTIQTDGNTIFRDIDDSIMSSTDFFNAVMQGSLVKAKGTAMAGNVIDAEEVEFESQ